MGGRSPTETAKRNLILPPLSLACLRPDKEKARLAPGSWLSGVLQQDGDGDRQDHDARHEHAAD